MTKQEEQTLEKKALNQLLSGKSLFGKDGAFAPMLRGFIEKALEAEMAVHLCENPEKNKRNGKGKKTLKRILLQQIKHSRGLRGIFFKISLLHTTSLS